MKTTNKAIYIEDQPRFWLLQTKRSIKEGKKISDAAFMRILLDNYEKVKP